MTTDTDRADGGRTPGTFQNRADESLSETVVRAVATTSGRSALGTDAQGGTEPLEPLYEAIDPDALDALFRSGSDDPAAIEFDYCGYGVRVERSVRVTVRER